ncbi:hypothetical protein BHE74_00031045 [Ensete ventricosum]|nr:hypothetical protein BHE74_00031045 [Ensete ventricosum]
MGSRMSTVSQKFATVMNFVQSRVSIDFSCTIMEIQNTRFSKRISPLDVVRAWFHEKI